MRSTLPGLPINQPASPAVKHRFTVMTPTYNRARTLGNLCEGLQAQTFRDFEWVIVDDGSTDGTRELVASWQTDFPIRYFWKPNGGKHTAMNLGVRMAAGEFIAFVDSDDCPVAIALERFDYHYVDAISFKDHFRYQGPVDRWGVTRAELLREYPFPEGEKFVIEGLVWNRIARKYAVRFFNEPLLTVFPSPNSLSRRMTDLRLSSPKATLAYYREMVLSPAPMMLRFKGAMNYVRFKILSAVKSRKHLSEPA
jgi:hypothetical protein